MSLNSRHDIFNDISVLLLQGGNRGQNSFRKTGAVVALIAEASLAPQTAPHRALSARLLVGSTPGTKAKVSNAGHSFKRLRHRASALGSPQEAPRRSSFPKRVHHRHQLPPHLRPGEFARLIAVPDGEEPLDLSESPGSQRSVPSLAFGERLKISFQVRPADLTLAGVHYIIGPPPITVENAREGFADKLQQSLAASGARDQEDGCQSGYRHPQPLPFPLFLPTRFIQMLRLGLGHRLLGFPVGDRQGPRKFLRTDSGCCRG